MSRTAIINTLIRENNYQSYLEIGVSAGVNFKNVDCKNKESVDPADGDYKSAKPTHKMTSDEFFNSINEERQWDIIFIDGLHHSDQVYKDIQNSLQHLNPNGAIVCHDMNPQSKVAQEVPRRVRVWNGDCWKAWVRIRSERSDLEMYVYDTDQGTGVIRYADVEQPLLKVPQSKMTYSNLEVNRREWLNLRKYK